MTYAMALGLSIVSFTLGWWAGRKLLQMRFRQELDALQKHAHEQFEKIQANNLRVLELTEQLRESDQKEITKP